MFQKELHYGLTLAYEPIDTQTEDNPLTHQKTKTFWMNNNSCGGNEVYGAHALGRCR